jgi:hypothetical protein
VRARRFGQMIREADRAVCTIIARIRQPLLARAQRSMRPRPELLVDVARAWREQVPADTRLGPVTTKLCDLATGFTECAFCQKSGNHTQQNPASLGIYRPSSPGEM